MGIGGFFGGGNESASTRTTKIDEERSEAAGNLNLEPGDLEEGAELNSSVIQGVSASGGSDVNLELTDQGAVDRAFEFGDRSLKSVDSSLARAFAFGGEALDAVQKQVSKAQNAVTQAAGRTVNAVREQAAQENDTTQVVRGIVIVGSLLAVASLGYAYINRSK